MSLTDEILKLPTQWRALADDFNVTRGDSEVEAAFYRCADELEAVSREAVLGVVAADNNALRDSLRAVMKLIEDGFLVRNILRDDEPGWAMRQIPMVQTLAKAAELIVPQP